MNNPLVRQQPNIMQMLQQLKQNPTQMLQRAGLSVPQGVSDPNAIIQHLMRSGQLTQDRYNQLYQMAQQMRL
ncbi:MAG: hypothetical protein IJ906_06395 [Oscillospiraceae bacterium]|nr:hypothetical protein [Oscillospiraceae bacterium]